MQYLPAMLEPVVRRCGLPFLREAKQMPDDLKNYGERPGFFIFTESEAGALIGALLAALVVFDVLQRLITWFG